MTGPGMTVAVTGVGGLVGRRTLPLLLDDERIDRVIGLDVALPSDLPVSDRLQLRRVDVRDAGLAAVLAGVDVVIHLAFVLDPMLDEETMRSINVDGTRNVFAAAAEVGARKVVYTSSMVVYGGHPDNDLPLTESSPLRANPDFNYVEHKYAIERWLESWVPAHPDIVTTILRPAIVAGPGVENFISRQFEMLRPVAVKGHRPPWQFAHVDDVASAIHHAVVQDLPGPYNVACEGWIPMEEMIAVTGAKPVELPEEVAFALADRLWKLGLGEAPQGELHYIMHPVVMSVEKLRATGWEPRHTNRDALRELYEEHHPYVTLVKGVRMKRRDLYLGAAGAGLAGGVVAGLAVRRVLQRS